MSAVLRLWEGVISNMVKKVKILLDKPTNVYLPGEIVNGKLYVEVDKPKPYKTISVSIIGTVIVNAAFTVPIEELFKDSITVWQAQKAEDGSTIELPPGSYNFPFQFALPLNIPTSFEGRHGKILYRVHGKVSSGLLKTGHTVNQTITVFNSVTFDNHSVLGPERHDSQNAVTMACCVCISGPVSVSLHLPRTGFCIGEAISFSVDLSNRGGSAVQLVATLKLQESYMQASGNRKCVFRNIGLVSSTFIPRRQTVTWNGVEIPIRTDGPLSLLNCNRIRVGYYFELKMNIQRVLSTVSTNSIQLEYIPILVADATNVRNRALLSQYGFVREQNIPPAHTMTAGGPVAVPFIPAVNPLTQFGSLPRQQLSYHPPGAVPRPVTNRSLSLPAGPPPTSYYWPTTQMVNRSYPQSAAQPEHVPSAPALQLNEEVPSTVTSPIGIVSPQPLPGDFPPSYEELQM